jgi:SAM-dependent methyltransferase
MAEWFEDWFGEDYLALYPHRDAADADRAVDLIAATIPWRQGLRVLDIASGPGRHAVALEARHARPVGIDLSMPLLRRARELTDSPLVRADMRWLPIRDGSVDLAVNLFTSFGYFSTDDEHRDALAGMVAPVRSGGWFALDFLNADLVRATLVPEGEGVMGDIPVRITRRISSDDRFVIKEIDPGDGRVFREQVRLFRAAELEAMLAAHLDITARFGDYDGGALTATSPRAFFIGARP